MVVSFELNLFLEHKGRMKVELLNFRNDYYTLMVWLLFYLFQIGITVAEIVK